MPMTVAESTRASTPLAQSENGATAAGQAFQLLALQAPGIEPEPERIPAARLSCPPVT
jgi:hypothetical protein